MKIVVLLLLAQFPVTSFAGDLYGSDLFSSFKSSKKVVLPEKAPELKFSNTQKWAPQILERAKSKDGKYLKFSHWKDSISLPPPPANTSETTKRELAFLMDLQIKRNGQHEMAIKTEIAGFIKMGPFFISDVFIQTHSIPILSEIFFTTLKEVNFVFLHFKNKFDRPRPHVLASELRPNIFVPAHPAYPSGHSSQAYILAELMSFLEPGLRKEFEASAFKVARNREIAGVHYPSDSEAGRSLAKQVMKALLMNPDYKKLAISAQKAWQTRKQQIKFKTPHVR